MIRTLFTLLFVLTSLQAWGMGGWGGHQQLSPYDRNHWNDPKPMDFGKMRGAGAGDYSQRNHPIPEAKLPSQQEMQAALTAFVRKMQELKLAVTQNIVNDVAQNNLLNLSNLGIDQSKFEELLPTIEKLVWLKRVNLSDNSIESIPESFGQSLKYIEALHVDNNKLKRLPSSLLERVAIGEKALEGITVKDLAKKPGQMFNDIRDQLVIHNRAEDFDSPVGEVMLNGLPSGFMVKGPIFRKLRAINARGNPLQPQDLRDSSSHQMGLESMEKYFGDIQFTH